eukprot:3102950-Rhodomonas_salina.4
MRFLVFDFALSVTRSSRRIASRRYPHGGPAAGPLKVLRYRILLGGVRYCGSVWSALDGTEVAYV